MSEVFVESSVSGATWEVKATDDRIVQAMIQRFHVSPIVAQLLCGRNVHLDDVESFLNPTLRENLADPFSLKDMKKAAERMAQAVMAHEPVGLMGDYDVDGATSTAVLKMFLKHCRIKVYTFIPDREDGYGPNAKKMHEFKEKGCSVVATLDCGMTAFDAIQEGTDCGLDVIVLDHHDPEKKLPNAFAVVNPKRLDEPLDHPCRYMAAVGVVFLFVIALNKILREKGFYTEIAEPNLISFLDLVALGTVCDVVKLQGINRLFVRSGLRQMSKGTNIGINALAELTGLSESPNAYHLGFVFGPRINACGRVGQSDLGMQLLSCEDQTEARILAQKLEELNLYRREVEAVVLLDAIEQVEKKPLETPFILVQGENWHQGVVGLVAGRLKDKYNLPVFALSIEGDEVKGSSRSVSGVDLGAIIMNALQKGILCRGGGHPMAAGFSLKKDRIIDFIEYLKDAIKLPDACKKHTLTADAVLNISAVCPEFLGQLDCLSPFGEGNAEPKFILTEVMLSHVLMLKNGHIACTFSGKTGKSISGIAFRCVDNELGQALIKGQNKYVHVIGVLRQDKYQNKKRLQIQIQDLVFV